MLDEHCVSETVMKRSWMLICLGVVFVFNLSWKKACKLHLDALSKESKGSEKV